MPHSLPRFSGILGPTDISAILISGGWTRDAGGVVRLTTITDQVGVGTTTPLAGSKMDVVADDAVNNAVTDVLVVDHTTSGAPAAGIGAGLLLRAEGAAGLQNAARVAGLLTNTGAGTEAGAITFSTRTGGGALTERWRIDATGNLVMQGDLDIVPAADDDGDIGTSLLRFTAVSSRLYRVYAAAGDAQAAMALGAVALSFGPGGAGVVDISLGRLGAGRWTCTGQFDPDVSGNDLGQDTLRWDLYHREKWVGTRVLVVGDSPYSVQAGDYQLNCDTSGGAIVIDLPATASNRTRQLRINKVTTDANAVTVTPPGGSTIAGGAATVVLAGGAVRSVDVSSPTTGLDWVTS